MVISYRAERTEIKLSEIYTVIDFSVRFPIIEVLRPLGIL